MTGANTVSENKTMPRTALGRARLASLVDLVSRPLDFEYYPGVFKFWIDGARFRDRSGVGYAGC